MAEQNFITGAPQVKLLAYTSGATNLAVASARTCYSPRLIEPNEITPDHIERIGKGIYESGHHTPFTHPTFVFGLSNVSRQFVWSFLHNHPFYNSEQQSQRYVAMKEISVFVPPIEGENLKIYKEAIAKSYDAYAKIWELMNIDNFRLMESIGKIKGQNEKQIKTDSEKKSIENARYVLPIAANTALYHTISGIVLKRYIRMMNTGDCPYETRLVVEKMIEEVKKVEPDFIDKIPEEPMWPEVILENFGPESDPDEWVKEFDKSLDGHISKLISFDPNSEAIIAQAVRDVLALRKTQMSDAEAIEMVMNPAKNAYLLDTLNSWTLSPLMRVLNHANYTFKKRISHTADSQNQRHRMTPASKIMLSRTHTEKSDYIIPAVVAKNAEAAEIYKNTMELLWEAKNKLIANGVNPDFAVYLLPNAVNVRMTESASVLHFMHKWRMRTCFNAQTEIYDASMDELMQVREVHPNLNKYIGPPCFTRNLGGIKTDLKEGPCPEGPRWCGISVWLNFPKVKRPF
ncbi:MAG: FAD-dependent thymidylate synthase [Candidatus Gracilibacteria bacterium]